jgi:pyrimidine deaminase RibD-like protein
VEVFMLAALGCSRKKLPEYLPNPSVACVIGDADQIVAQRYTEAPAQYHTELVRWLFTHL